ncbi:Ish1 domain-containing protein [Aspergillus candidus]|uniref:Uncharacterized protein n=1 Tax=Aspergillus candidus TaxID=41067 RepID=A0A2I2FDP2_ASPCN|nr:hypothetical protein BDW47DRAFT_125269 [Aspergillus candidus]PLB38745.1 hypothetical protein BDW47DRAFT_125269 [Aspergillus candidus]
MPTPLDRALHSKNLFMGMTFPLQSINPPKSQTAHSELLDVGFAGMVTAAAAWAIWGNDMFPEQADPTGDPEQWTVDEMRRWLRARGLMPDGKATREELLERVKANLRIPRNTST